MSSNSDIPTREEIMQQYAEQIASYEALIAEAQRHYDAGNFEEGHRIGGKADLILDYEICDRIAAEFESRGLFVGLADFSAMLERQALAKAIKASHPDEPLPYMLEPAQAPVPDIRDADGKLDIAKVIAQFSGPAAAIMAQWDYEAAGDLAPWDYDGGREEFEQFVQATGWAKPVMENLAELEAEFAAWQLK